MPELETGKRIRLTSAYGSPSFPGHVRGSRGRERPSLPHGMPAPVPAKNPRQLARIQGKARHLENYFPWIPRRYSAAYTYFPQGALLSKRQLTPVCLPAFQKAAAASYITALDVLCVIEEILPTLMLRHRVWRKLSRR